MEAKKQGPVVTVTPDGRASIDVNQLFQDPEEVKALRRLSSAVRKQIERRAALRRAQAPGTV